MLKGIDVSHYQGDVDWKKVKATGVQFAIIRAGYGKYAYQEDPCFEDNIKGAYNAGIPVGVYWYSYADTVAEARQEAEVCLTVIKPYKDMITLPVFFDQEYEPAILTAGNSIRTQCCVAFIETIEAAGYKAGLYGSQDWLDNRIDAKAIPESAVIWVAQYASRCTYTGRYTIWQYTSDGSVDGIKGRVDLNQASDDLLTSTADGWQKIAGKWYWYEDGKPVTNAWRKITGASGVPYWYYLGPGGVMLKGMQKIGEEIFYLNEKAAYGVPEGACVITDSRGNVIRT